MYRIICLFLICYTTISVGAQVSIGLNQPATYGALLEIRTQQAGATVVNVDDANNVTSTDGGLLLPRVKLDESDLQSLNTVVKNGDALTAENKMKLAGLMVYNINEQTNLTYLGVYVWNGSAWAYLMDSKMSTPMFIKTQPKEFTFYETGLETPAPLVFEVVPTKVSDGTETTVTYQWFQIVGMNKNALVKSPISGAISASYTPNAAFKTTNSTKSTLNGNNNNLTKFYCVATGSDGLSVTSKIVEVAVGCGAKTNTGDWISFMCFNLGATNGIKIEDQKKYAIGGFSNAADGLHTYIPGEEKVWGDLYQWGRITDGHQKRNSDILNIGDGTTLSNTIINGYYCFRDAVGAIRGDRYPEQQVATTSPWYGKYITSLGKYNYNWHPNISNINIDQLWKNARTPNNDPCAKFKIDGTMIPFWTTGDPQAGNSIQSNDAACQESGTAWRLPMQSEFQSIYDNATASGTCSSATANKWQIYQSTTSLNNSGVEIQPDDNTTTLYLPINGKRDPTNGNLYYQGSAGYYWTTDIFGIYSYALNFSSSKTVNTAFYTNMYRSSGAAIRCIKN